MPAALDVLLSRTSTAGEVSMALTSSVETTTKELPPMSVSAWRYSMR